MSLPRFFAEASLYEMSECYHLAGSPAVLNDGRVLPQFGFKGGVTFGAFYRCSQTCVGGDCGPVTCCGAGGCFPGSFTWF
jgi:hypothetical protein